MLSTLNEKQRTSLITLFVLEAKAPEKIKKLLREKSFGKVYNALSAFKDLPFSVSDFIAVGMLASGVKNAHFFLVSMEARNDQQAISSLKKALESHCWGKVAATINQKLKDPKRHFSGSDLHFAHNPNDKSPCLPLPTELRVVLEPIIGAGVVVGAFFSDTLADFFEQDFLDFFAKDITHLFTDDIAGFFANVGGFFTDDVGGFFTDDVGDVFNDGFEDVGDFFGGLF